MTEQPGQGIERKFPQPLPLVHEPLLERLFIDHEPVEEIAAVERGGLLELDRSPLGNQLLEAENVDIDRLRVGGDGVAVDAECWSPKLFQCRAEEEKRLPQRIPRICFKVAAHSYAGSFSSCSTTP